MRDNNRRFGKQTTGLQIIRIKRTRKDVMILVHASQFCNICFHFRLSTSVSIYRILTPRFSFFEYIVDIKQVFEGYEPTICSCNNTPF